MIWLLSRLIVWPVKGVAYGAAGATRVTAKTASTSARLGYRTGRLMGYRNLAMIGVGVAIGVALAPRPGRETREKVRAALEERGLLPGSGHSGFDEPPALEAATTPSPNGHAGGRPPVSADLAEEPGTGSV